MSRLSNTVRHRTLSRLLYPVSCLPSPVFRLLSPVSCLSSTASRPLSHVSRAVSAADLIDNDLADLIGFMEQISGPGPFSDVNALSEHAI